MCRRLRYSLVLFGLLTIGAYGQPDPGPDSVSVDSTASWQENYAYSGKVKKWKALVEFDTRRSFFSGRPVKINGIRLGAELNGVHRFGIGFYGLSRNLVFKDIRVNRPDATDTSYLTFNVGFGSLFYERVVFATRRWEFAAPIVLGAGSVSASYTDTANVFKPLVEDPFSVLSPGFSVRFKVFRWLALGTGLGYRMVFNSSREVRQAFTGVYYKYGVSVLFGELYRMAFKKD